MIRQVVGVVLGAAILMLVALAVVVVMTYTPSSGDIASRIERCEKVKAQALVSTRGDVYCLTRGNILWIED